MVKGRNTKQKVPLFGKGGLFDPHHTGKDHPGQKKVHTIFDGPGYRNNNHHQKSLHQTPQHKSPPPQQQSMLGGFNFDLSDPCCLACVGLAAYFIFMRN